MELTEAQARRVVRRADLEWDETVEDPRADKNQRHDHHGLLSLVVAGFACGRVRLRQLEDLSEDLGKGARRRLGLSRRVSDTTLYRVLAEQGVKGLRETVRQQMRCLVEGKVIRSDAFPVGVVSIDGKCTWTSTSTELAGAKRSVDAKTGVITSSLTSLRAVLTSSSACPLLDLEFLADKTGEAPTFRTLFPRVTEHFGKHFQIVTGDAGLTCRENALQVAGQRKHYAFAVKGNQPQLHQLAEDVFASCTGPARVHTADRRGGTTLFRELHILNVEAVPEVNFPNAVELWRLKQVSTPDDGSPGTQEVRYFVSSIPTTLLTPSQKLELIRLHWGIENGHNWTVDVALEEDDVQPCQATRQSIEVITWLRALAFNLLATWRASGPKKDKKPIPWRRAMEQLRDSLIFAPTESFARLA